MNARSLLATLSAGRIFFGLIMLLAPRFIGERWFGAGGTRAESVALMRVAGVRDAAMGVGGLLAARSETDPRPWLAGCAVADVTDAYATLTAAGVPVSNKAPSVAVALGAAAAGIAGLLAADDGV
jgi:hypothetical protein